MLGHLEIENIILVKKASLDFSGSLCVLTGETGSGKSIVLTSILTLLGKETKTRAIVRSGCKYGSIEGIFINIPDDAEAVLLKNALTPTKDIKIKCIVQGTSATFFVNNQQVPQSVIKEIGSVLVEVNRQHEQTHLMDEKNHITILDEYALIHKELAEIALLYKEIQDCERDITEITERNNAIAKEIDYLNETAFELKNAGIQEGEYDLLQEKRIENKRKHSTFETLTNAQKKFESVAMVPTLVNINRMLAQVSSEEAARISEIIERVCTDINELDNSMTNLIEKNYINITEIDKIEERFFYMQDLARKHKIQPYELLAFLEDTVNKIENFNKAEESVQDLNKKKNDLEKAYMKLAKEITAKRQNAAKDLSSKINNSLASLQMPGATFQIDITPIKMQKNGTDKVVFTIETNRNTGFHKLAKIASGGEISRIVLAIKSAIAHLKQTPCVIFDEIDTGISGKTSNAVGEVLLSLAKTTQILVITHQPQVASKASDHFRIIKKHTNDETETTVEKLSQEERINEIARLLSGKDITKEALLNAQILLNGR